MTTYTEYEDYIQLNIIYDPKWENASTSVKTIKDALKEKMEAIKTAVISIKSMNSDITEDALLLYKTTLDLNKAIQKISSYEQNKAEVLRREEARKQQEEERRRQEEINRASALTIVLRTWKKPCDKLENLPPVCTAWHRAWSSWLSPRTDRRAG